MDMPDFSNYTTEDLKQLIPENENNQWEFKAAEVFDKANFGEFKSQKLGPIVSAFANSGGGFLLLGKSDGSDRFDPVPTQQGKTSMEDHLSQIIAECVTPQYRHFHIFRIPITGRHGESVLLVRFDDSPLAPHQSNSTTQYYIRIPGHCVPAPHAHLEFLRSRQSKAAIEVAGPPAFKLSFPFFRTKKWPNDILFCVNVTFTLRNISSRSADHYALHVFGVRLDTKWHVGDNFTPLYQGAEFAGTKAPLYPTIEVPLSFNLYLPVPKAGPLTFRAALPAWEALEFSVKVLGQDFAGEVLNIHPAKMLGEKSLIEFQRAIEEWQLAQQRQKDRFEKFMSEQKVRIIEIQQSLRKQ